MSLFWLEGVLNFLQTATPRLWHCESHKDSARKSNGCKKPKNSGQVDCQRDAGVELEDKKEADQVECGGDGAGDAPGGGGQELAHENVWKGGQTQRIAEEGDDDRGEREPGKWGGDDVAELQEDCQGGHGKGGEEAGGDEQDPPAGLVHQQDGGGGG